MPGVQRVKITTSNKFSIFGGYFEPSTIFSLLNQIYSVIQYNLHYSKESTTTGNIKLLSNNYSEFTEYSNFIFGTNLRSISHDQQLPIN